MARVVRAGMCAWLSVALIGIGSARSLHAELVPTESAVAAAEADQARADLAALLARDEVRGELERFGVSADDARARIAALSDREVIELEGRVSELAAGGDFVGVIFAVLIITVTVLVVTDLLGFTDVFTFINPLPRGRAKTAFSAEAERGNSFRAAPVQSYSEQAPELGLPSLSGGR